MKSVESVKSANYLQINHEIRRLFAEKGVILMPSPEAYEKIEWTRNHFPQEPTEGYFIWVKKQVNFPISTCIAISSPEVYQNPTSLVIVEKGIKAEVYSVCNTVKPNLSGKHVGYTKIIMKENSNLKIMHFHKWGKTDDVTSILDFILQKGSKAFSSYKCITPPKKLKIKNKTVLMEESSINFENAVLAEDGEVDMFDSILLKGKNSKGIVKLRMVSNKNSRIISHSKIIAEEAGRGHIDCMGLLLSESSSIDSLPELLNKNKNAILTHEASIGKISEEELNYLRSRGLTEDEAIGLIITGFLGEALPSYKGYTVPTEGRM